MSMKDTITNKLTAALSPTFIDVIDDSHRHAGHAGNTQDGESHFDVIVVSDRFEGQNRVQRQREVYAILSEEMKTRIHALALKTLTPSEYENRG